MTTQRTSIAAAVLLLVTSLGVAPLEAQSRARSRQPADRPASGTAVPRAPAQSGRAVERPPLPGGGHATPQTVYVAPAWYGYRPYRGSVFSVDFSYGRATPYWGLYSYGAYGYPLTAPPYMAPAPGAYGYGYGSVRLVVKPREAQVSVDGYFVGIVDDFDGVFQHLYLEPGPHRIDIYAPGLETITFDVRIDSDRRITYRGDLQPAQP